MKAITTIVFAAALAFSMSTFAGCGGKKESKNDKLLKEYSGIVDEMCACKDFKCMEDVSKKMKAFGKKAGKKPPKDMKDKVRPLRQKMQKCMKDLMKASAPKPGGTPPAPAPAPADGDKAAPSKVEPATK